MPPIDLTLMSSHGINERKNRFEVIENTIGWGRPKVTAVSHLDPTTYETLTSTGVIVVRSQENLIITAYVARVSQALAVWHNAKGAMPMPKWLWNVINYNNNTEYWQNLVAA